MKKTLSNNDDDNNNNYCSTTAAAAAETGYTAARDLLHMGRVNVNNEYYQWLRRRLINAVVCTTF